MTRGTMLAALGGTLLAAALATGTGWVLAQPGANNPGTTGAPVAVAPEANGADPLPQKPKPPVAPPKREADEFVQRLEKLAASLEFEITTAEKAIGLHQRAAGTTNRQLDGAQKRLLEAEAELAQLNRTITKLEAERTVLTKRLDKKPEPDMDEVQALAAKNDRVLNARAMVRQYQDRLDIAVQKSSGASTPEIKKFKEELARATDELTNAQLRAAHDVTTKLQAAEAKVTRDRIAALATDIEVQKEVRTVIRAECDQLKKLVDEGTETASSVEVLRNDIAPKREVLAKVRQQLLVMRAKAEGATLPEAIGTEAKLDQLLREVAELRKELQELKDKK